MSAAGWDPGPAPVKRSRMAEAVAHADEAFAWAGGNLATITDRWADDGPRAAVLALCGEHHIPPRHERDVLELLRVARSDVQHLVKILAALRGAS